ncbi:CHAT domain-containing protein [Arthrobacter sp. NicSoilB8]|uniref:CHAT domain-containing protein n=1 Tax=Arthrobacter sp. NicSoilB8 TaxID=2830998 RepID=UPI001CC5B811|nr:CHAT domain-containing protein [Arthrobacter sp. NicSoilB8]BCW72436.1 hypothetical protein NicSoilB8_34800 [Arthrobacter sp. NicSoilB8]
MNSVTIRAAIHQLPGGGTQTVISLEDPPIGNGQSCTFISSTADDLVTGLLNDGQDVILQIGTKVYADLSLSHPDVAAALQNAAAAVNGYCPLLVELPSVGGEPEKIPWETVCGPNGTFLALDSRWSVARVVRASSPSKGDRVFHPPLRLVLLLSCFGIPAADEWNRFAATLDASTVETKVLVFAGEPGLEQKIADEHRPNVEVRGLPGNAGFDELRQKIREFRPDILHFYCHGLSPDADTPHLELATPTDWLAGRLFSPLLLEAEQISMLGDAASPPWLVVLNCCEAAATRGNLQSLARDLVARGGYPAVVGMREPIVPEDAICFSGQFYKELLTALVGLPPQTTAVIDWPRLLVEPRRQLIDVNRHNETFRSAANNLHQWTVPVLYVQSEVFKLIVPGPAPAAPLQNIGWDLTVLRYLLANPGFEAPPSFLNELDEAIKILEPGGDN